MCTYIIVTLGCKKSELCIWAPLPCIY
jgi:hypothetical protein